MTRANTFDHTEWDRPENIWSKQEYVNEPYLNTYMKWWTDRYYQEAHKRGVKPALHNRFFKQILGGQSFCVLFSHQNWVWCRPRNNWTLYVDMRGPAFHVKADLTAAQSFDTFMNFQQTVEGWFDTHAS